MPLTPCASSSSPSNTIVSDRPQGDGHNLLNPPLAYHLSTHYWHPSMELQHLAMMMGGFTGAWGQFLHLSAFVRSIRRPGGTCMSIVVVVQPSKTIYWFLTCNPQCCCLIWAQYDLLNFGCSIHLLTQIKHVGAPYSSKEFQSLQCLSLLHDWNKVLKGGVDNQI